MIVSAMKYRSRTDIIVSMLDAARHEATKTKIMYSSYLSSHQLRPYLELVTKNGLLAYDSTRQRYVTTDKGLRVLELYDAIDKLKRAASASSTSQKQENNPLSQ
jgi:predicted transcriptional regulator